MVVYFAGLTALAAVLIDRQPIFFVFAVIGFVAGLRAAAGRSGRFLGVVATSVVINIGARPGCPSRPSSWRSPWRP